uniref:Mobile element protein n=1 Tax=Citrobacter freundii TaxID=546 RepID=A0A3G4RKE8_CITFR|nr:hypothetical protein [Escherichia coli]AYU66144.1 Mobile element protein [Citrobacter freundii]
MVRKPPLSSWNWDILPQIIWDAGFRFMNNILLNGHYTFQSSNEIIDLDMLVAGLKLG